MEGRFHTTDNMTYLTQGLRYTSIVTQYTGKTGREKLKKYFPKESVKELIELFEAIGETVEIKPTHFISRDAKDNFLLLQITDF